MINYNIGKIPHEKNTLKVQKNCKTKKVVSYFKNDKDLQSIVVLDDKKPIGLVMRDKIFFQLGTRFGFNLYMDRCIEKVMDHNPLIVDYNESLSKVSKLTMQRSHEKIYDEIIITKDNLYFSTVSIKDLLLEVSRQKILEAKNANPLTGLPGNLSINKELLKRVTSDILFSVLYIDLDNFKAYNDTYGYQKGDDLIRYTANVLKVSSKNIDKNAFIGHVGGDDFIVITKPEFDEKISEKIINKFENNLNEFYNTKDYMRGYIYTTNRQKELSKIPISSLSIAIISNENLEINNHLEIGDKASEVKKIVKKMDGSNYMKDRRTSA
ncbi:MAG: GGDEF domain-containing protein [Bacillota bacterium]